MRYFTRLFDALRYSWLGIKAAMRKEPAFQTEVFILPFAVAGSLWFGDTAVEKLLLFSSWMLVMIVELLNSAIENTVDRISKDHHKLSGRAKDMGSAAVLFSLIIAAVIWATIILA